MSKRHRQARSKSQSQGITLTAVSVQSIAAQKPLRWPPVIPSATCDPQAFGFNWRRLQFLFPELLDPRRFPALPDGVVPAKSVDVLRRFQVQAVHLAESTVVNKGASMSVRFPDDSGGEPAVDYSFPPQDAIAGFSVLFRQCYSPDEKASFAKTQSILRMAVRDVSDHSQTKREAHLSAWAKAQGQLRSLDLMELCGRALAPDGERRGKSESTGQESPEFIISAFNYGADIHWGDKRDTLELWNNHVLLGPHQRMRFFESAVSLAYVYVGVAELIEAALGAR